jgi:hypothetical protein
VSYVVFNIPFGRYIHTCLPGKFHGRTISGTWQARSGTGMTEFKNQVGSLNFIVRLMLQV